MSDAPKKLFIPKGADFGLLTLDTKGLIAEDEYILAALSEHPTVQAMVAEAVAAERERCANRVKAACPKCSGAGWLWGDELDDYEHPHPGHSDDTRYSCDGAWCAEAAAIRKGETP